MNPLVACVMATCAGRKHFLTQAVRYWKRMTYEPRQLFILDDDPEATKDLFGGEPNVFYYRMPHPTKLGEKLNAAVALASADYFVKLDDDDWYSPDLIDNGMKKILAQKEADRCIAAPSSFPVYIIETGKLLYWMSHWSGTGTGMFFTRRLWLEQPWNENVDRQLDRYFITRPGPFVKVLLDYDRIVYVRHKINHLFQKVGNESVEDYFAKRFKPCREGLDAFMPKEEAEFYWKLTRG